MCQCGQHTIHALGKQQSHCGWDCDNRPELTVVSGDCLDIEVHDASGGQLSLDSGVDDVINFDFDRINPVTGPVWVEGAEPGDALKVTLLDYEPSGWGWTANIPGFGLLADEFEDAALHLWQYDPDSLSPALFNEFAKVPLKPFAGTIGVAPPEKGFHSIVPPRRWGGNMDIRDLAKGSELWLPVGVEGALFSIGDTHAAQGDGEVCGTAIESPMTVSVKLELEKAQNLPAPKFATPGPVTRHLDAEGYHVTTGVNHDLMTAARDAVRYMIDELQKQHQLAAMDAYMLCSVCGDLRISEIVDAPNWIVSFYFPKSVFS
ncbi:acetamidase/formamidase family protein [Thiomicrospira sp. S5]|uniref:acetamidase/formamidase family protein n=1 Tax=Thiomicrospira sp. S5 TaxID=1803865 RepID=UPI000F8A03A4|nr:acetamidase/formamidase family protein [Thiomicrospira sp. S5]AZR81396.1 acetamidase [Thiomicrospira sp. S5]AZR81565.1 acetamidase [Thiomicrospira sp. S5]